MRNRRMCYFIYFTNLSVTFRNNAGDLFRGFPQDTTSAGCCLRRTKKSAMRLGRRLVKLHSQAITVEQCVIEKRHGRRARWVHKTWDFSGPTLASVPV